MKPGANKYFTLTEEMKNEINNFKNSFLTKYGFVPSVQPFNDALQNAKISNYSLHDIEVIINNSLAEKWVGLAKEGIRTKTRDRRIVRHRHMFYKWAFEFGFGPSVSARYLGYDHATAIHSVNVVDGLLSIKDNETMALYNDIKKHFDIVKAQKEGKLNASIDQLAYRYAVMCHEGTNHLYNGKPYYHHLKMVIDAANKFIELIPEEDRATVLAACWVHDVIEDCRQTYNDVKKEVGEAVADIAFAVTNEKGKTRAQRAGDSYYRGIKETPFAVFVKCCDRIANIQYSLQTGSRMTEKYKAELPDFEKKLCTEEYWQLFDYMKNLF